ncbi:MAG: hypothetical protein V3573_10205 [Desulfovibrionaceae bacterium]
MKRIALLVMLMLACAVPVLADGFEQGMQAYQKGDFVTARQIFGPLSEQGDARAQFALGVMYEHGKGVEPDQGLALKWYSKAASQGHEKAALRRDVLQAEMPQTLPDEPSAQPVPLNTEPSPVGSDDNATTTLPVESAPATEASPSDKSAAEQPDVAQPLAPPTQSAKAGDSAPAVAVMPQGGSLDANATADESVSTETGAVPTTNQQGDALDQLLGPVLGPLPEEPKAQ